MREIKFRAWVKNISRMASWDLITKECNRFTLIHDDNFIFMQYIDKKDKNGAEVYEGDVVASPHFKDAAGKSHTLKHIVQWSHKYCGWQLLNCTSMDENDGTIQLWLAKPALIEIIGNIYQHPELLK